MNEHVGSETNAMQGLARGLTVLELVADRQPIGVGELSKLMRLPKSTVQRTLRSLAQAGWLKTSDDSATTEWVLTQHVWSIGQRAGDGSDLRDAALPHMRKLGDRTGETIHLSVPDGKSGMLLLERVDSTQPVRTYNRIGARMPFHSCSSGKAVMAFWKDHEIDVVLDRHLEAPTSQTITDRDALKKSLDEVRSIGYSVNNAENRPGVCAVGAPILTKTNYPMAAVCISMPDSRFEQEHVPKWGQMVKETAAAIEAALDC